MSIKHELSKLKETDLWSLLLFALFKLKDCPEYSGISELAYILDKKNLFKLCEYFGGTTITIPTVEELETLVYALLLYQYVDIEHMPLNDAQTAIAQQGVDLRPVRNAYQSLSKILREYEITSRG